MPTSDVASSNRAIITVLGSDRPGIVAAVTAVLADDEATILQGVFTMTMLVDLEKAAEFAQLKGQLAELSESLGVQITLQREEVFRYMYRL